MVGIFTQGGAGASNLLGRANVGSSGVLSGTDLISVARNIAPDNGIGISKNSRQNIRNYLNATSGGFNSLFSLGAGSGLTIEGAQQQILALRSGLPENQVAPDLRGRGFDESV